MNTSSNIQANVIDGITGPDNIADYWRQHFQKILNSNDCDISLKSNIMRKFEGIQHNPEMVVSTNSVIVFPRLLIMLYISEPGYQLPVSKLSVCLRSAVNV